MAEAQRGRWRFVLAGLLVAALAGGYLAFRAARGNNRPVTYAPSTGPTTQTAPAPGTRPATKPRPPTTSFIDVVRTVYPGYTTTRPLDLPVRNLAEAARIVLTEPVYMGPSYRPDLWLTRADGGATTEQVLKRATDPKAEPVQVHVVPDRVRFVHWNPGEYLWTPYVVCDAAGGGLEVVSPNGRRAIPVRRRYDWARANSWNDKIVVPSEAGVSVFRFEPEVKEDYRQLIELPATPPTTAAAAATTATATTRTTTTTTVATTTSSASDDVVASEVAPQALLDYQGLLAWVPAEGGNPGSRGAARYVDDKWVDLGPEQGWPERILHLVPLRDGSVLRIEPGGPDGAPAKLALATLYSADLDEAAITALVEQMSDPEADRREAAFKELSQFGPGAYPVLEKLARIQPPEARARVRQLMREQVQPTLGGMTLLGGTLRTVSRHEDGGVVFYAEAGVAIPREGSSEQPARRVPAWLAVRPGRAAEILDELFVSELNPDGCEVMARRNEWVVTGDAPGPRRWVGNGFTPLLKKDEAAFAEWLGIDARGRWLFRKPGGPGGGGETLVLDPRLPDPTPRLPFWEYASAVAFGWDRDDWPAVRRQGGEWSLREQGWRLLDAKQNERMLTDLSPADPFGGIDDKKPPSKWSQIAADAAPLLTDADGSRYYDGLQSLRVVKRDGSTLNWPLPAVATGQGRATLLRTPDGVLFLFNQPGRVLRIRQTPDGPEPFAVEATFTRKIPSVSKPKRIWMDPAGRIVIADARRLIIFFPEGFIPPRIRDLMPFDRNQEE